ncbi:MAG: YuiA family protein [Clostridia bacterium]
MMPTVQQACLYCDGQGYFHVVVGGTESCPQCEGSGQDHGVHARPLAIARSGRPQD